MLSAHAPMHAGADKCKRNCAVTNAGPGDRRPAQASIKMPPELSAYPSERILILLAVIVIANPIVAAIYAVWKYGPGLCEVGAATCMVVILVTVLCLCIARFIIS